MRYRRRLSPDSTSHNPRGLDTTKSPDSWLQFVKGPRSVVLAGALLTHIWRFHDLSPALTALRLAALFTLATWAYLLLDPRGDQLRRVAGTVPGKFLLLFMVWSVATIPFAYSPGRALEFFTQDLLKTFLLLLFIVASLRSVSSVWLLIQIQFYGALVLAFYYAKGGFPTLWTPVPMYDRNDLALLFVITVPMGIALAQQTRSTSKRSFYMLAVMLMAFSVLASLSRGGTLALLAVMTLTVARSRTISTRVKFGIPVAIILLLPLAPQAYWERMGTMLDPASDYNVQDEEGRIQVWQRGLGYLRSAPVTGLGLANFQTAERYFARPGEYLDDPSRKASVAHNSFLEVAVETGVPGVVFFTGGIVSAIFGLLQLLRRSPQTGRKAELAPLAEAVSLSLIAFVVGGFFLSHGYMPHVYVLAGTAASILALQRAPHTGGSRPGTRPKRSVKNGALRG